MANIMSQVKLKNKTSRNGFDLSKKNAFTAKVGELLPVYCKEVLPGDKFKINLKSFTRTRPVNTAAFTRIREYYDFFFVPTNLLWNKFNTFVTQMTDNGQQAASINGNVSITDEHPYFTLQQLLTYLASIANAGANENEFGFKLFDTRCKLLEYLGYGDMKYYLGTTSESASVSVINEPANNPKLNPFPLLAYQKIYSDFFRNSQWEQSYAPTFNINYIQGTNDLNIPISALPSNVSSVRTMFDLRYANWNKDYFMGLLPNSQYGDVASVNTLTVENQSLAIGGISVYPPVSGPVTTNSSGELISGSSPYWNLRIAGSNIGQQISDFTILALRQAEAKQKWAEITQSNQQDYKSQVEAHFGVNVSDAYAERCKWLGGISDTIDINEVVNNNLMNSGTANSADIAGKGVGVNDGYVDFTSDVHGYVMCIYHAIPLLDYALITGIKRQNLKTVVTDYAIPELDQTGMVSVPWIELTNMLNPDGEPLLGYAPRYIDYKTDIDEVHGAFLNGGLESWVAPMSEEYLVNQWKEYVTVYIDYQFFKVNPSVLNPIFNGDATSDVDSDQLLINSYFDVKAVRNLDVNGLPY